MPRREQWRDANKPIIPYVKPPQLKSPRLKATPSLPLISLVSKVNAD